MVPTQTPVLILAIFFILFYVGQVTSTSSQDRKTAIIQKCLSKNSPNTTTLHVDGSDLAITSTICPELAQLHRAADTAPTFRKREMQNMCTQPCIATCANSGSGVFPQFDTCNLMVRNLDAVSSDPFFVTALGVFSIVTTSAAGACTAVFVNPTEATMSGCYAAVARGIFQVASVCFKEVPPNTETEGLCTPTAADQQWEIFLFGEPTEQGD